MFTELIGRLIESGPCAASQVPNGWTGLPDPSGKHYFHLGERGVCFEGSDPPRDQNFPYLHSRPAAAEP